LVRNTPVGPLPKQFDGWEASVAWSYNDVVTTWKLERSAETQFLKMRALGEYPSLADERDRLEWARDRVPVPRVLDFGIDNGAEWLLLTPLSGIDATTPELKAEPTRLVPLLAEGLRAFHEIDAADCPFDFRNDAALAHVRSRVEAGILDDDYEFHDEFAHLGGAGALARLEELRPATEDVVVCHGDYCLPNVLFENWKLTGFLDLGELGLADRWWDVAVGAWSVTWNLGPGYEELFYEAYGVQRDPEREEFYRLLYSVAS
jgi:aminoglycoside phosphotransferase